LFLSLPACAKAEEQLASRIETVVAAPDYKQARWGILVVDSKTGEEIYARNPDQLFLPASTTKLYSCAAALAGLGPNYRFETPVYYRGTLSNGKLNGDLILVAQGDLTFGGRTDERGQVLFKNNDHTYANGNAAAELTPTDPLAGLQALARMIKGAGILEVNGEVLVDDRYFAKARGSGSGPDVLSVRVRSPCVGKSR
jgi:D-alanyl-D-alanine carboxypeptidase/D-alanyl-D-alanine-endopeptidase (penicillin-binding protein 4)